MKKLSETQLNEIKNVLKKPKKIYQAVSVIHNIKSSYEYNNDTLNLSPCGKFWNLTRQEQEEYGFETVAKFKVTDDYFYTLPDDAEMYIYNPGDDFSTLNFSFQPVNNSLDKN